MDTTFLPPVLALTVSLHKKIVFQKVMFCIGKKSTKDSEVKSD